jgi:Ca2+-transporting ATPase
MELIIDPACSTVFEAEAEEANVMNRPPREKNKPLFGRRTVLISLLQGGVVLAITLAVFAISRFRGHGELEARAMTFTALIMANLGLILTNRSWSKTIWATLKSPNKALWWVVGGATFFLGLVLYNPFLRNLFHFAPISPIEVAICLTAGTVSILWFEAWKMLRKSIQDPA